MCFSKELFCFYKTDHRKKGTHGSHLCHRCRRHDDLTYEERTKLNYDHPDAFDTDLMIGHLRALKAGRAIDCPTYDYTVHNRSSRARRSVSAMSFASDAADDTRMALPFP